MEIARLLESFEVWGMVGFEPVCEESVPPPSLSQFTSNPLDRKGTIRASRDFHTVRLTRLLTFNKKLKKPGNRAGLSVSAKDGIKFAQEVRI